MGVNTVICLPHNARADDIATVLASLAGAGGKLEMLPGGGANFVSDAKIRFEPYADASSLHNCRRLTIDRLSAGRIDTMFHYDLNCGRSQMGGLRYQVHGRGIMPASTAWWIAIAAGLVDFFGGAADYADCDDTDIDVQEPERDDLRAHDGAPWDRFQRRMAAVQPISAEAIKLSRQFAGYPDVER
jgi:hypothetical protein